MAVFLHGVSHRPLNDNETVSTAGNNTGTLTLTPPAGMQAGDLVVLLVFNRGSGAITVTTTGGQTWTANTQDTGTANLRPRSIWCVFNGTWTADPQVGTYSAGQASMLVFRSNNTSPGFSVDQIEARQTNVAPTVSPFRVSTPSITPAAGSFVLAWWSALDNEGFTLPVGSAGGSWGEGTWRDASSTGTGMGWAYLSGASNTAQTVDAVQEGVGSRNNGISAIMSFTETGTPSTRQSFQPYMLPTAGHT